MAEQIQQRKPVAGSVILRQAILDFIATYRRQHGYGPSFNEFHTKLGLRRPFYQLNALESEGYITFDYLPSGYRITRSLRLTRKGEKGYG